MYPFLRLLSTSIQASLAQPLDFDQRCETHFTCMPWDLDIFFEMNNGRILTLYDLGRFNLATRIGLGKVLKQNHWGLVVAGSSVIYRKRIRVFDRISMSTKIAGYDEKWIYLKQSMWVKENAVSSLLIRTGITNSKGLVPTSDVLQALSMQHWKPTHSKWLRTWIESEKHRPWPPID